MCSSRIGVSGALMLLVIVTAGLGAVPAVWSQESGDPTVPAPNAQLRAKPVTCVALHKDQVCFQKVTLSWSRLDPGDYCLYLDDRKRPLTCWFHNTLQSYSHEYQSVDSMRYQLREGSSDDAMAEVIVNTSWVYRTGRRSSSGWRLF